MKASRNAIGLCGAVGLAIAAAVSCSNDATSNGAPTTGSDAGNGDDTADASTPSDASTPESDADAGDPCAGSFFCDDFEPYEAGAPPGMPWTNAQNGGSIAIDATHAHSGKNAVKFTATQAAGYRSVLLRLTGAGILPVIPNHVFGRMMFWLDSSPTTSVHWTFIDGYGATPGGYHALYRYGGQTPSDAGNTLMANYDTPDSYGMPPVGPSSDCYLHSKTAVPTGTWSCAEWEFDGPNDTMRFWLDGAPVNDSTMVGTGEGCVHQPKTFTWTAPEFDRIDLGWESYQADNARTLWIDDVALGKARLACPH